MTLISLYKACSVRTYRQRRRLLLVRMPEPIPTEYICSALDDALGALYTTKK